ncbi:TonB C-terminal domain-containing protein [Spirochaetes bacterium]|uniref:TonB C-terminal domain-containing protein n=1 Tax=Candidatus Scatousia excrementipullorum TaxID=2840936 RepID=A0A9D9DPX3_9BACT|nr:TonB C-terminal domain-containing protein [Candidatus Scatousia excrementipullorum]
MFRCTVCQKLYTARVKYCDCGNDEFVYENENIPVHTGRVTSSADIFSVGIFLLCIILSILVLFFYNPVKPHRTHKTKPKPAVTTQSAQIPDIDSVWDDTPAYIPASQSGSALEIYKKSLQNMLNSNIQPKKFSGSGQCEIEFTVTTDGKLVNRKIFKHSGSDEFNNIIVNMLKNTNEHRIPPSDYLGEPFRGEVIVQDGLIKLYIK